MVFGAIKKLVAGLAKTREGIATTLRATFQATRVDEEVLDELEAALLQADLGPSLAAEVVEAVRREAKASALDGDGLRRALKRTLLSAAGTGSASPEPPPPPPRVVFIVGVNGGGKTTTIGKLAARERAAGRSVVVVAADTFRAAAIDQLERWAERAGVEVIRHREGADPSAVVFDALRAARTRGVDTVLVDTAGRLHTKAPLMAELEKMARVAGREIPGAPHEVLLVLDATTGQNGLQQARLFGEAAGVTGVALTKLDGSAKGGIAVAIAYELGLPVKLIGVGESLEDLRPFDAQDFARALVQG